MKVQRVREHDHFSVYLKKSGPYKKEGKKIIMMSLNLKYWTQTVNQ